MPPLKGIDRGLDGTALKALEEAGHGRRLAIVDASYDIPRDAEVINYFGETSADALKAIVDLVPVEGDQVWLMEPDTPEEPATAFSKMAVKVQSEGIHTMRLKRQDDTSILETPGFYSVVNNSDERTLFVRTRDRLPYACATFIIGHMQEEPPRQRVIASSIS